MSNDQPTSNQQTTATDALINVTGQLGRRLAQLCRLGGDQNVTSDALRSASGSVHDATRTKGENRVGVVVESIPHLQQYRVLLGSGKHVSWCTRSRLLGGSDFGMRDNSTIPVGTPVIVQTSPFLAQGIITGVLPNPGASNYTDMIVPGGSSAAIHKGFKQLITAISQLTGSGFKNCAGGSPMDGLTDGALNISATTGMMLHVDRYMAQLRIDEMTGLFLYYWDRLTRLAGYNFARWTANSILESYDDEGEHLSYEGWTVYPWEQKGILWDPAQAAILEATLLQQRENPGYTRVNPIHWDQQPFHRLMKYKGYLGQGQKTYLCAPPEDEFVLQYGKDVNLTGLFEETLTLSGHYGIRTATGFTLAKRPIITIPKRKKLAEDPAGDNRAGGYKPSGYEAEDHKVETTLSPTEADEDKLSLLSSAGVLDLHSYLFNWESAHPFRLHENDFSMPEESDFEETLETNQAPLKWEELQKGGALKAPEPKIIKLDHRNEEAKVYPNTAYITVTDDGALVFGDGYGAEIRMGGGTIRMSAPGDIMLESGRNVMSWAGRDVILKARQNIEGTTSEKDISFKAEQNIKMLAANDEGPHHILLECRAQEAGKHYGVSGEPPEAYDDNVVGPGIILNTQKSEIIGLANNVYMRAVANTAGSSGFPNGVIALDAPSEYGVVRTSSTHFVNSVKCAICHFFKDEDAELEEAVNYFTGNYNVLGKCTYINESLFVNGCIVSVTAATTGDVSEHSTFYEETLLAWLAADYLYNWDQGWWDTSYQQRPGCIGAIPLKSFAFRDAEKYCSEAFALVENRWMSMARSDASAITEPWVEKSVEDKDGNETWPFPGITHESGANKWYYIYDNVLYAHENGISKDSDDEGYAAAEFGTLDEQVFNEKYLAIAMCVEETGP